MKKAVHKAKRVAAFLLASALLWIASVEMVPAAEASYNEAEDRACVMGSTVSQEGVEKARMQTYSLLDIAGTVGTFTATGLDGNTYTHDNKYASTTLRNGIDVSKWEGSIDWKAVASDPRKIEYAIVRLAYRGLTDGGLHTDPYGLQNLKGAKAAGLLTGAYIYSQALNTTEAIEEAKYILNLLNGTELDLPVVFDMEHPENGRLTQAGLSRAAHMPIWYAFRDYIESHGYKAMIYCSSSAMFDHFVETEMAVPHRMWIARYNTAIHKDTDRCKWNDAFVITMWQYTSSGQINGITGKCDCDVWYDDGYFTGSKPEEPKPEPVLKPVPATTCKVANTTTGVNVTWTKADDVDSYLVYRQTGTGSWTMLATLDGSASSYLDKTPLSGKTYSYRVQAKMDTRTGSYTTAKILYLQSIKATASNTSTGVKISWPKVEGATAYRVYRRSKTTDSWTRLKETTSLSYTDTGAANGSAYYYCAKAINGSTSGAFTTIRFARLKTPAISSLSNLSGRKLKVTWGKNSYATGYQIQYSTSSSFTTATTVTVNGASTVTKTISSLTKGKTYYVRVRSYKTVDGVKYYSGWGSKKYKKITK